MSFAQMYSWLTTQCRFWFDCTLAPPTQPRFHRLLLESLEDRFVPSLLPVVSSGLNVPHGVAVDANGNLYIADTLNNAIKEWVSTSNTVTTLVSSGLNNPYGVAVDASGNVYIADTFNNAIKEWVRSSNTVTTLVSSGLNNPYGVAVDASGNVYIADTFNNAIKEWMPSSNTVTTLIASGLNGPCAVAFDATGDMYIADAGDNAIAKWVRSSNTLTTLVSSGLSGPEGVAVDGSGNVYVADTLNSAVEEWVRSAKTVITLVAPGPNVPTSVAVDGSGTLYIADSFNNAIEELAGLLAITTEPEDATVTAGQTVPVSLTVAARGGTAPLSYQWQISTDNGLSFRNLSNGSGVAGATTMTLNLSGFTTPGSPEYQAVVTDATGATATSSAAILTINAAPSITSQPQNATVTVGQSDSQSFAIEVSGGSAPLSYQWQISTDNGLSFSDLSDGSGVAGATTPTLTLSDFATAGFPEFQAVVTDASGVTIASSAAALTVNAAPIITTQPQNATVMVGQSASQSFAIAASRGSAPLSYQWQISTDNGVSFSNLSDGSDVAGATTPTLTLSDFTAAGTPEFQAIVSDAKGVTVTSSPATLIVNAVGVSGGVISGTVFHDYNANGVQDPDEPGLAGQTIFVDLSGSGVWQPGDPTALTDANGNFQLAVSSAGTYTVRQLLLGGVLLSAPGSDSCRVTLANGENVTGQDFADVLTSIAVPLTLPPSVPFPAQGNANADYVEAVYRAVLNRNADSGGLGNWTTQLSTGALSRLQVVQGIRNSPEHFTQEVLQFYLTLLNRPPDPAGLQNWVQQLEAGMKEEQIAFDFLDSPEYLSQGDKHFVDAMYLSLLGRSFDAAGEATWLSQLGDDTSGNATHPASLSHEQVITAFLYSTESETRLTEGYYEVFLQRPADAAGLNGWVGALQQGVPFLSIGQQFLSSDEFYSRAAQQA